MKRKSINALVAKAGLVIFAVTAVAGGAGLYTAFDLGARLQASNRASEILRNHMEADMMHDAMRADVLAALATSDPAMGLDIAEVTADAREHASNFTDMVERNAELATQPAVKQALADVAPGLKTYIASAEAIIAQAATDRAGAIAALPGFMKDFSTLETAMGDTSDKISAAALAEVETGESRAGLMRWITIIALAAGLVVVAGLLWSARRLLVTPIADLTGAMKRLAEGDTTVKAPHAERQDEIGGMAAALTLFRENAVARQKLEADQKVQDEKAKERAQRVETLVAGFAGELSESLGVLNRSSGELMSESGKLESIAQRASESSRTAIGSTAGASSNVQSIAAATTELSASIEEISSRMSMSAEAALKAASSGEQADSTVTELSNSAQSIGDIVAVISSVASQTNLLALNATIEAARAGEAGRGFAVVATEVKALASQTSRATEDIASRVTQIQDISTRSVSEVQAVIKLIEQMREISTAVAAAAEQQSAATNGIAQNVNEAAGQADEAASSVNELAEATARTRQASAAVQGSAKSVETLAQQLRVSSEDFFEKLRAA